MPQMLLFRRIRVARLMVVRPLLSLLASGDSRQRRFNLLSGHIPSQRGTRWR